MTLSIRTVGSVPPLAPTGSAPADCGPTRSAPVTSGTCAIEPPAPTERTFTLGT